MVKWIVEILPVVSPIFTAAIGYVVAARGEIEVEHKGEKIRIKNLKPSGIKEVLEIIDARNAQSANDPEG
jgi:hypothetical protein